VSTTTYGKTTIAAAWSAVVLAHTGRALATAHSAAAATTRRSLNDLHIEGTGRIMGSAAR
jgi:hypothetical protein